MEWNKCDGINFPSEKYNWKKIDKNNIQSFVCNKKNLYIYICMYIYMYILNSGE